MPTQVIVPWFLRNDYEAIKTLIPDFEGRRDTFEEWLQSATQRVTELETRGVVAKKAVINSKEFSAWCASCGFEHNFATLGAFAVKVGGHQDNGGT